MNHLLSIRQFVVSPTWLLVVVLSWPSRSVAQSSLLSMQPRGAAVSFFTHEAEVAANRVRGTVVSMTGLPRGDDSSPEMEASGRAFVQLSAPGDYLEFPRVGAANTLVIRASIPDALTGGGISAPLSLYVNGRFRQKLMLSSRHAYLYGEAGQNGQSNDPNQGQAHVFWDEARFFIQGAVRRGDTLRLQKDATDTAAFYRIDLIDLENAPAPLSMPKSGAFLSVAAFGATGNDASDDTSAIAKCIEAAKIARKGVWIPAGTYFQSAKFALDGVAVRGAGMWRTHLVGTVEGTDWGGKVGFELNGQAPGVADLSIDSAAHTSRSEGGKALSGSGRNWRVERVWVTHTLTGAWLGGSNGVMRGCRIRDTYADAINLNNGASDNVIEQNHVRGCGDDGLAILSESDRNSPLSMRNTLRFNTVSAIWWGHNCDVAGGSGHLIEDNLFADNAKMGCLTINQPGAYPMNPLTKTVIRRNSIVRGGGNFAWQRRGAVWIYPGSTSISEVLFQDNSIIAPIFRGIHLTGSGAQNITFERNLIEKPGEDAIFVDADVTGHAVFQSNTVRGLAASAKAVVNGAKAGFELSEVGNSWR